MRWNFVGMLIYANISSNAIIINRGRMTLFRISKISYRYEQNISHHMKYSQRNLFSKSKILMWGETSSRGSNIDNTDERKIKKGIITDEDGREFRSRGSRRDDYDDRGTKNDFDDYGNQRRSKRGSRWDDYDGKLPDNEIDDSRNKDERPNRRSFRHDDFDQKRRLTRYKESGNRSHRNSFERRTQDEPFNSLSLKTNLRDIENAGFEHLYGVSPVLNALRMNRRDFTFSDDSLDDELKPRLFIQEYVTKSGRNDSKAKLCEEIEYYAGNNGLSIEKKDKGALNSLVGNRPHQGFVLRTRKRTFQPLTRLLPPNDPYSPLLYLVLDEVMDPQNFGALLRSAYFLGGSHRIQVVTCQRNSAPPSPTVSAASAGALEMMEIEATNNLPKLLKRAREDGWNILGAALSTPPGMTMDDGQPVECTDLYDVHSLQPTVLVLGSEGFGLRTLVAKACSGFLRIQGFQSEGIDSLNVSVTGGIMIWHLINCIKR